MNKTGLVLKVEKNKATLLTNTGEFVKVVFSKSMPKIGETFSGVVQNQRNYLKYLTAAVALFIVFLSGGGAANAYYTAVATIKVSINPSVELKVNRFDKIIKSSPINADGVALLKNLQLNNKNTDEALTLMIDQAKKDNFINNNYNSQGKIISVNISAKDNAIIINLDKFQKYIAQNKINTEIDYNGKKTNQEFIKIDKSSNKQVPTGNIKDINNSMNKNNNNSDKNISNDKVKPIEGENKKGNKSIKNLPTITPDKLKNKLVVPKLKAEKSS